MERQPDILIDREADRLTNKQREQAGQDGKRKIAVTMTVMLTLMATMTDNGDGETEKKQERLKRRNTVIAVMTVLLQLATFTATTIVIRRINHVIR